jgi:PEP-CTERM motif
MHVYRLFGFLGVIAAAATASGSPVTFSYTGTVTTYTIPTTGLYDITVAGAQGGPGDGTVGGMGAVISGDVNLTAGTMLDIVVGGIGLTGDFGDLWGGGGGGGTFVYIVGATSPLLVAGGGGGAYYYTGGFNGGPGDPGQITASGDAGLGTDGGAGGTAGSAGAGGSNSYGENGGGGAGWLGNGGNGVGLGDCLVLAADSGSGNGGFGPPTFAGGIGGGLNPPCANGGFGGGGGGGFQGGGGGGGYSGGGGGDGSNGVTGGGGGGGGSYVNSLVAALLETAGANAGNGYVTLGPVSAVPEPSSFALLGLGVIALGVARRFTRHG